MERPLQAEPLLDGMCSGEDGLIRGGAPNIFPFIYLLLLNEIFCCC